MTPNHEQTINKWNELGFYYEHDNDLGQWRFIGSKDGLTKLVDVLILYSSDPKNGGTSEHLHLGPYSYLKIMTWHEPVLTSSHIGGTLKDLMSLGKSISAKLEICKVGQIFKIGREYSPSTKTSLLFIIMSNDFLPSSIEFEG